MTTTWLLTRVLPVVAFFLLAAGAAWLAPKVKNRLSPTQPQDPGDDDREASGADPEFARELKRMRASVVRDEVGQELLANLRTSALEEVAAHEQVASSIDALCDDLMAELDALCAKYAAAAKSFGRRHTKELALDAHGRAWLAAGLPGDTGEFDRRQLDAMLAGAS